MSTFETIYGPSYPHSSSPVSCNSSSQRIAVEGEEIYNIYTVGDNGSAVIQFGDSTVEASVDGSNGILIREDLPFNPIPIPLGCTHMAIIGFGSDTPKLFVLKHGGR